MDAQFEVEPRRLGFADRDGRVIAEHGVRVVTLHTTTPHTLSVSHAGRESERVSVAEQRNATQRNATERNATHRIVVVNPDAQADVADLVLRVEPVRDQRRLGFGRDGHSESHRRRLSRMRSWSAARLESGAEPSETEKTHLAQRSFLAVRLPELTPDAEDRDGLVGVVLDADMEQVVRVAVGDAAERVRVGELDQRFDVGRGGAGQDSSRRREEQGGERGCNERADLARRGWRGYD